MLKSGKKIIIGYDLTNTCSQISFGFLKDEGEISTVGIVEGEENFDIPTVLCKRVGSNQWLFGHDALRFCREHPEEGILVTDLLHLALEGEPIQIEGRSYHPAALLTLFIKRSLGTLVPTGGENRIASILFTCEQISDDFRNLIQRVGQTLDLKSGSVSCQCYQESFFSYVICQPEELWREGILLLDYRGKDLSAVYMDSNHNTVPKVMYCSENKYDFAGTDRELRDIAKILCEGRTISTVYLIGEKFGGDWMSQSLQYLCSGRRVFQGNNLYSKGACYELRRRKEGEKQGSESEYIFLGPDVLKANVGMKAQKRGQETYCALLDAGMNWRNLDEVFEVYLKGESKLELLVTPLLKNPAKHVCMELEGLTLEAQEVTRMRMRLMMPAENILQITVTDLGFGEFRQASDGKWIKEIEVY